MDAHVALLGTAAAIGCLHTLLGPDHYLPFVAMARVGRWSVRKTLLITLLCGLGHVSSSVLLGAVGVAGGVLLWRIEALEAARGDLAGWLLLSFGIIYLAWGVMQALRNAPHTHLHAHADGTVHEHFHQHQGGHLHAHASESAARELPATAAADGTPDARPPRTSDPVPAPRLTPWVLFTVFLFGPCEPLIPMLMYPAAEAHAGLVVLVALVFGATTLATMSLMVGLMLWGVSWFPGHAWHRYSHALAGLTIAACGLAVTLGL